MPQGPELESFCGRTGCSTQGAIDRIKREHFGLILYPLEWVSHILPTAVTVFADMDGMPGQQVFFLGRPARDLVGYAGAVRFDFYHTRFGRRSRRTANRRKVA